MRITQVMLCKGFGGAERSFLDTTLALADRGHAVQAVCHRDFVKRQVLEEHPGVRCNAIGVRGVWDLLAGRKLTRLIGAFGPDVIHTHLARSAHVCGPTARRLGVPMVAKLHNYVKLKHYRHVTGMIGTTEDQYQYLTARVRDGVKVTVIPNFSRFPTRFLKGPAQSSNRAGQLHIVSYGRLHVNKGFDVLLKAASILVQRGVDFRLSIGGDGPERASLHHLTEELGLRDRVHYCGWVADPLALLDSSDLFVLSSRVEPFGIVVLEAMLRGVPIVSTRCPGPLQILDDQVAWFAECSDPLSLANGIQQAIADRDELRRRGELLRQRFVDRYSEEKVIPQILDFYRACGARDSGGQELESGWRERFVEATSLADVEQSETRMLVDRELSMRIRARGWTSCAAVMRAQDVDVIRVTNGRDNCRVDFDSGRGAGGPKVAFLKRHHERLGASGQPSGWREAEAVAMCESSGVSTMRIIATGYEKPASRKLGASVVDSFSLSEAIPGEAGFETVMKWHADGVFHEPAVVNMRRQMIEAAADLVRRMHAAGLVHQDLFWTHLFFENRGGMVAARVIDVQRMIRPSATWAYYWIKDLEQIRYSMQRMRFSEDEIAHWYCSYFATESLTHWQRLLTGVVRLRGIRRALRMAIRNRRRSQPATTPVAVNQPTVQRRAA